MDNFPRHVVYAIACGVILTIAALCADTRFSGKTSASSTPDFAAPTTMETVEETVTLSAADVKTWVHYDEFYSKLPYCGPPFKVGPVIEPSPGSIAAGYKHLYDKGAKIFGCPERLNWNYRGTVWFDLSAIVAKAPPLHVYVKSAALGFKAFDVECAAQLLIASKDWSKGYADNELVPGDPFAKIESCGRVGCSIDVQTVVNNWVRGEDHGGYANNGFVVRGEREGPADDNDVCMTRYGEFSLKVTYTYDKKEPVLMVPAPQRPEIMVSPVIAGGRENVALASNGATATASSTLKSFSPGTVIDGERRGINFLSGGGWNGAAPTNNDWLQIDFKGSKAIDQIDVFTVRDDFTNPAEPILGSTKFTKYGLVDFKVQYWNRFRGWVDVPAAGNPVKDNYDVWKQLTFSKLTTNKIRVLVSKTPDGYSRLTEVEAWGK